MVLPDISAEISILSVNVGLTQPPGGSELGGSEPGGSKHEGSKPDGSEPDGSESGGAEPGGAENPERCCAENGSRKSSRWSKSQLYLKFYVFSFSHKDIDSLFFVVKPFCVLPNI